MYLSANLADKYGHLLRRKIQFKWLGRKTSKRLHLVLQIYFSWWADVVSCYGEDGAEGMPSELAVLAQVESAFSDRLTFVLCSSLPTPNLGIQKHCIVTIVIEFGLCLSVLILYTCSLCGIAETTQFRAFIACIIHISSV